MMLQEGKKWEKIQLQGSFRRIYNRDWSLQIRLLPLLKPLPVRWKNKLIGDPSLFYSHSFFVAKLEVGTNGTHRQLLLNMSCESLILATVGAQSLSRTEICALCHQAVRLVYLSESCKKNSCLLELQNCASFFLFALITQPGRFWMNDLLNEWSLKRGRQFIILIKPMAWGRHCDSGMMRERKLCFCFYFLKMQGIVFTLADAVSIQGPSILLLLITLPRPPLPPFSQVGESEVEIRLSLFFF